MKTLNIIEHSTPIDLDEYISQLIKDGSIAKKYVDDMEEHFNKLIKGGYMDNNGYPLKCTKCNSCDFEMVNKQFCQYGLVEYGLKCNNCGCMVGFWSYGHWQV